jgi:hypothetical protein
VQRCPRRQGEGEWGARRHQAAPLRLADDVLEEKVDKGVAAVASQVLNVYLRAVSVELKAREQLELVERLEVLEETLARNKENRWYGA